jgi:hypothetical protein
MIRSKFHSKSIAEPATEVHNDSKSASTSNDSAFIERSELRSPGDPTTAGLGGARRREDKYDMTAIEDDIVYDALESDLEGDSDFVGNDDNREDNVEFVIGGNTNLHGEEKKSSRHHGPQNLKLAQLVNFKCCAKACLLNRTEDLSLFLKSIDNMSKELRQTCILSSLSISISLDRKRKSRSNGMRSRYHYVMPFLGEVCKEAFMACFDIANTALHRLRKHAVTSIAPLKHGNASNQHAKCIDDDTLKTWLLDIVAHTGHTIPLRQKRRETFVHGQRSTRLVARMDKIYVLPPTIASYEQLHQEYCAFLSAKFKHEHHDKDKIGGDNGASVAPTTHDNKRMILRFPSEYTLRRYIKRNFPDIRLSGHVHDKRAAEAQRRNR